MRQDVMSHINDERSMPILLSALLASCYVCTSTDQRVRTFSINDVNSEGRDNTISLHNYSIMAILRPILNYCISCTGTSGTLNRDMERFCVLQLVLLHFVISLVSSQSCSWYQNGDLRLVSGTNEGRVEICIGGEWGTICDDGWYTAAAKVACRQLGFEVDSPNGGTSVARPRAYYGQGSGPIFWGRLSCRGTESTLLECGYNVEVNNFRYCDHSEDAGAACPSTPCTHGDVRLAGGLVPTEGRVEVCNSGRWTAVCYSSWNYQDAFVVCRQLGYPATEALPFSYAYFGLGVSVGLTSFLCYGNESQLLDCDHSTTSSCSRRDSGGVRCLGEIISALQCFDGNTPHVDGAVRLVGGEDANEGRVEICSNGLWGSVCSSSWDSKDASVVCRQLGFQNPVAYTYFNAHFGAGTGPILLNGMNCIGTEARLQDCQSISSPVYCYHSRDVGIRCARSEYSGCSRGEIRLVGGPSEYEGRVEICINGVWGSVCQNSWSDQDARVVCRQIGLPFQLANAVPRVTSFYGESVGPFHLNSVGCRGSEENLLNCYNSSVHACHPGQEAGVKCNEQADCLYGDVRLVGGEIFYEGRLEVCIDSYWVSACNRNYLWNENTAMVICRQITGEHNPRTSVILRPRYLFGQLPYQPQLHFSDVNCDGSEERLVECSHSSSSCYHYYGDAGVICYVSSNCNNGTVRLVDGETETQGRVEICQNGTWWAVSDSQWDLNDAIVVCRHLGYPFTWVLPLSSSFFGRRNSTVLIQDLGCFGNESTVNDCSTTVYSIRSQYDYYDDIPARVSGVAGVVCAGSETSQPECEDGELRLVGGQTRNEGRVEVCEDGFWATICDENWGQREAMVVCRQAGLPTTGAVPVRNASYGDSSGPFITTGINCMGTEATVFECNWETNMICNPVGRSAGVICQEYTVTVISDPPVSEGPFLLGSTVTLHCSVNPAPPQTVTYTWRDSVSNAEAVSVNSTSPNATLTIPMGHPHEARYFCWTQSSDGSVFGVGSININVKGFLHPIGDTHLQLTPSQLLSMRINITSLLFAGRHFRSLTWYHNGIEISPANDQRVTISSDNTTLTIENPTEADAGVYEAKFTGLLVHPFSEICEKETLALVRHYPLASPVVFYASTQGGTYARESHRQSSGFTISIEDTEYQHPLTLKDTISLTARSSIPGSTQLGSLVSISWYHNGDSLPTGAVIGNLKRLSVDISQSLKVENSTFVNSGITEAMLQLQSVRSYLYQFSCPNNYRYFITYSSRGGIGVVVLDQTSVHFNYYELPIVSIQPNSASLKHGEHTSLLCTAEGGYPHSHKTSWIKNGEVIANGTMLNVTNTLTIYPFGQYTCVVNNSVITRQGTILVKEEGTMEIQLDLHSYDKCTRWNESTLQEKIDKLIESLTEIIQRHCMCTFSTSDLQGTNATCSSDGSNLSVHVSITYSSTSGLTTASDVIQILQNWMQDTPSAIFVLGGTNVSVAQVCTPMCTANQPQQPQQEQPQEEQQQQDLDVSAIVGALFGGLFAGTALIAVPAIIIFILMKKKHTSKAHDIPPSLGSDGAQTVRYASAKPESVQMAMKSNESYETVDYPEEGIYEVPT